MPAAPIPDDSRSQHPPRPPKAPPEQTTDRSGSPPSPTEAYSGSLADRTPSNSSASGRPPNAAQECLDFLAPAEQPDELGRLGGYRVISILGAGAMGVVLEAEDP